MQKLMKFITLGMKLTLIYIILSNTNIIYRNYKEKVSDDLLSLKSFVNIQKENCSFQMILD